MMQDVILVGGGPVGAAAALGLARAGVEVTLLEARSSLLADDRRTLAIAQGSREILEDLGAWPDSHEVTPLLDIHVSQKGHFGQTVLTAAEAGVPALGYVMRYNALVQALARALQRSPVRVLTGATVQAVQSQATHATVHWSDAAETRQASTALAILADGGRALTAATFGTPQESPYTQVALVAQVETDHYHQGRAYERFTPTGPVALLPLERHYALVWTDSQAAVEALIALPEDQFLARLQRHFGDRAGRFLAVRARSWFPLTLKVVPSVTRAHCLCIGNAAQTMHPVAGQGFNLGLRDAATLCAQVQAWAAQRPAATPPDSAWLGSAAMLAQYVQARTLDRRAGLSMTHALVTLFSNDWPLLPQLRGQALTAMNWLPGARRTLSRVMMFGVSQSLPPLLSGLPALLERCPLLPERLRSGRLTRGEA